MNDNHEHPALVAAVNEAKRFLKRVNELKVANIVGHITGDKQRAAVVRSSMDLSRALTRYRLRNKKVQKDGKWVPYA